MTDRLMTGSPAHASASQPSGRQPASRRDASGSHGAPRLPWPWSLAAAAACGGLLLLAFPPYDQWWLAPVGVGLLAVAVHRQSVRLGAGAGALAGLVLFVPLLSWTNLEIGNPPWLLLAASQAAFVALLGAAAAFTSPVIDRWPLSWPVLTALLWVGQEAMRARMPFGGFPWGRLAFSQGDAPLLPLAALGGAPLVTAATALAGGLLAAAGWRLAAARWHSRRVGSRLAAAWWPSRSGPRRTWPAALLPAGGMLAAAAAVVLAGLAVPLHPPAGPAVTVAVVQGNVPRLGLDFNTQRRAVLDNHVQATEQLAVRVAAGQEPAPDLVVWPENSSDIDPLANPDAGEQIGQAAEAIGAPILVGAIVRDGAGAPYNVGLVWDPVTGPGEMYAKQHPVPFAEYLPLEPVVAPVARMLAGDHVDRIGGFQPGQEPGVLALGPAHLGNVICFEVAYDALVRDTVTQGAQLLGVQTNNATFNEAEARQQLAMVRLRAVEHGRESLMASTVGISGFVGVDGQVSHSTGFFTQEVPVRTLSLTNERTVATVVGGWPELIMAGAAVAVLALAAVRRRAPVTVNEANERSG